MSAVDPSTERLGSIHPLLEARGVAKSYGATRALRGIDFDIRGGEIHALLGSNGAGKSTLVKILLGVCQPTSGELRVAGQAVVLHTAKDAMSAGVFPIYQHLSQFPHLTVRENLAAFALGITRSFLVKSALPSDDTLYGWLGAIGLTCPLDAKIESLSVGERQLIEIARAVAQNAKVLVLDEPTAALTQSETDILLSTIERLRDAGVGILYISHKLEEVERIADRVSVIRDGVCVLNGEPIETVTSGGIVKAMVGVDVLKLHGITAPAERTVLSVTDLRVGGATESVDFSVRAGEVLGLAGIVGCGADQIAAVVAGAAKPASGRVIVNGVPLIPGDRRFAVEQGVGFVPPDRNAEGLFGVLSAATNTSASGLKALIRWGAICHTKEHRHTTELLERLGLVPFDINMTATSFSGGNQQKIVVARNLGIPDLKVLVLVEPTRGVDVAARHTIHDIILRVAARGVAVVIATSDVDELLALSHQIMIVRMHCFRGKFQRGVSREAITDALADPER